VPVDVDVVLSTSPGWLCIASREVQHACRVDTFHSAVLMTALRHKDLRKSTMALYTRMQHVPYPP
jgi:hypothetical protein